MARGTGGRQYYTFKPRNQAETNATKKAIQLSTGRAASSNFNTGTTTTISQNAPGGTFSQGPVESASRPPATPAPTGTPQSSVSRNSILAAAALNAGLSFFNQITRGGTSNPVSLSNSLSFPANKSTPSSAPSNTTPPPTPPAAPVNSSTPSSRPSSTTTPPAPPAAPVNSNTPSSSPTNTAPPPRPPAAPTNSNTPATTRPTTSPSNTRPSTVDRVTSTLGAVSTAAALFNTISALVPARPVSNPTPTTSTIPPPREEFINGLDDPTPTTSTIPPPREEFINGLDDPTPQSGITGTPFDDDGNLNVGWGLNEDGDPVWIAPGYNDATGEIIQPRQDVTGPTGTPFDDDGNLNVGWGLNEDGDPVWVAPGYNDATGEIIQTQKEETGPTGTPFDDDGNLNPGWGLNEDGDPVWVAPGYNDETGEVAGGLINLDPPSTEDEEPFLLNPPDEPINGLDLPDPVEEPINGLDLPGEEPINGLDLPDEVDEPINGLDLPEEPINGLDAPEDTTQYEDINAIIAEGAEEEAINGLDLPEPVEEPINGLDLPDEEPINGLDLPPEPADEFGDLDAAIERQQASEPVLSEDGEVALGVRRNTETGEIFYTDPPAADEPGSGAEGGGDELGGAIQEPEIPDEFGDLDAAVADQEGTGLKEPPLLDDAEVDEYLNNVGREEEPINGLDEPDIIDEEPINGLDLEEPIDLEEEPEPGDSEEEENAQTAAEEQEQADMNVVKDWRVRIQLAEGARFFYKNYDQKLRGILAPLAESGGVIYPYTPTISVNYNANYTPADLVHSNYKIYQYKNSAVDNISITGEFTAQDTFEAKYILAVVHFFRTCTKMFYGQDVNPRAGTPPPLVYLTGYGAFQFSEHPMAITSFNYSLPNEVDYIPIYNSFTAGVNTEPAVPRDSQSPTSSAGASNARLGRDVTPGGYPPPTEFSKTSGAAFQIPTYVPTKIQITISCIPIVSRRDISENYSSEGYATGDLLSGFDLGKKVTKGIW